MVLTRELNHISGIAYTLKAMDVNAHTQQNFTKAKKHLQKALTDFQSIIDQQQVAAIRGHIRDIALEETQFNAAVNLYKTILKTLNKKSFNLILVASVTIKGL